jgi:hypothetical protein
MSSNAALPSRPQASLLSIIPGSMMSLRQLSKLLTLCHPLVFGTTIISNAGRLWNSAGTLFEGQRRTEGNGLPTAGTVTNRVEF